MITVELFCGTKSFSNVASFLGHNTFAVDNNSYFHPDVCKDILDVQVKDLPRADVLWASPPCTSFSVASIGKSWYVNGQPKRLESALGMAYVLKTLKLIDELKPKYWFIENPRGKLRTMEFMKPFHRKTVTYCQYGDTRMKPTDIWTNFVEWKPKPMCKNGDSCHVAAPRGSRTGTQGLKGNMERSVIPPELFYEIFEQLEQSRLF